MREAIRPFVTREEPETGFVEIRFRDGGADLYIGDDAMTANHIHGRETWDLLIDAARAADWVILPTGCPTCLTAESQRDHLPDGLDVDVRVVVSGAELLQVIESS